MLGSEVDGNASFPFIVQTPTLGFHLVSSPVLPEEEWRGRSSTADVCRCNDMISLNSADVRGAFGSSLWVVDRGCISGRTARCRA